jgi:2-polyprenyl-3-methyl-5-hydroxy-6-metoxy-1,4-benzoquinol methylase
MKVRYVRNEDMRSNAYLRKQLSAFPWSTGDGIATVMSYLEKQCQSSARILDVGCGGGMLVQELAKHGFSHVEYCDIDDYLNIAAFPVLDRKRLKLVNLNTENLPYRPGQFDVAIVNQTLEHLENPYHVARELHRVLKNGGLAVITVPSGTNIWDKLIFLFTGDMPKFTLEDNHITFFTKATLDKAFLNNGFRLERRHFNKGVMPFLRFRLPAWELFGETRFCYYRKARR